MMHINIKSEVIGPFHLKVYDSIQDKLYDISPIEEHTHDTYQEAYKDAESKVLFVHETRPDDENEQKDMLFIEDSQGNRLPYIQHLLN